MPPSSRSFRLSLLLIVIGGSAAFAGRQSGPAWYEVRKGDSLGRIAREFGTTVADLREASNLRSDVIQVGQRIEIRSPFATTRARDLAWQSPCRGPRRVLADFGPYETGRVIMPRTGVDVALPVGSEVFVPAHGVLRYLAAMEELGTIAIIDHGAGHHTVLSPLDLATVPWQPGQGVRRGDLLGRTAAPFSAGEPPHLHVELRIDGKAVRPDPLLR
ncbi:MAG TPA: LysM peptidoglycan-binding domain-containing M23 family metallopeptidase [Candidatus Krumholzibacteria bacterium]|nr:LysM peptidoglycan-binding domain-containing M23 family metallopeptidase [Candidatus Krumholzibacteria bacterium]HPD71538.1 LysM peptidoglycan-binding domain-containing M23 family metallopeptidase [Candidatus Krumholzibacteria bacterium]HRY41529.1 LysM peptidoglycan-binding domain-containing M23 family metallopeptidase [Candidatus Krumholzibacteria bacterium]